MKQLKQSETRVIKRSQINLNPINPKRHTDERVKLQRKNLQKVGFLGGIVWNETSGNLIDGHRRIKAMDLHYKYDGTPETDYEVKVEVVSLDPKTEKEQLTYMAVGNTKPDIDLLAGYISEIDYSDVGLDASELNDIMAITSASVPAIADTMDDLLLPVESVAPSAKSSEDAPTYDERKEHMKQVKQEVRESARQRQQNEEAYLMLSFTTFDAKAEMCDLLGISTDDKFAKGEDVLKMIN